MIERAFYLKSFSARAALVVALSISAASRPAMASTRESHKDIIEKATNLSIQRERLQAINILKNALRKESKKNLAVSELIRALKEQAFVFYSEKAQQAHELAISVFHTDLQMSQTKIKEALKLEPDNFSIEFSAVRISIALNDCDSALERVDKYKDFLSYLEELRLLSAQALNCSGKATEALAMRFSGDLKDEALKPNWVILEVESYFRTNQLQKALDMLTSYRPMAGFPELFYWNWKIEEAMKLRSIKSAQSYLNACKSMTKRQQRVFLLEPNLCRRTTEVENFLKKNNNSEI
jgi:hypothetical protein